MQEQALLTAIVQNLKRLCRYKRRRPRPHTGALACKQIEIQEDVGRSVASFRHGTHGDIPYLPRVMFYRPVLSPDF